MLTRTALEREAVVVATDAGDRGVGAAVMRPVEGAEVEFWAESWPEGGTPPSSTGKELAAVHRFVETHRELVRGRVLAVVSDSMCLVCGLLSGRSRALRGEMRALMDMLDELRCRVIAVWTPRELNTVPDALASLCTRFGTPSLAGRLAEVVGLYAEAGEAGGGAAGRRERSGSGGGGRGARGAPR